MRHRKRGKRLGRNASHRKALRRNMACSLLSRGRIRTTKEKAREVRQFAERLITLGKRAGLADFRRAMALLNDKRVVRLLFGEIAPRYAERPGGYTRILKLGADKNRLGDNAPQVILELVEEGAPAAAAKSRDDAKKTSGRKGKSEAEKTDD